MRLDLTHFRLDGVLYGIRPQDQMRLRALGASTDRALVDAARRLGWRFTGGAEDLVVLERPGDAPATQTLPTPLQRSGGPETGRQSA